jgi:Myb-like DNA-binding domain
MMVPRNPLWTPEEDDKLRSLILSSNDVATIAKQLKRTQRAIRGRATKLKLPYKVVAVGLKVKSQTPGMSSMTRRTMRRLPSSTE